MRVRTGRGLTASEVADRRRAGGANVLTPPPRSPWWRQYLGKFDDPVLRILIVAASVSILVGHFTECAGIVLALLLASTIAFLNEYRANREFDVLNRVQDDIPVKVVRDGNVTTVPRREIVTGDTVLLEAGEEIPADGILLESVSFMVDEARLTGESHPVCKSAEAGVASGEPDRPAYPADALQRGTIVVDGHGVMEATAVGDSTEYGRTARAAVESGKVETPLGRQAARLSRIIGRFGFAAAALTFAALVVRGVAAGDLPPGLLPTGEGPWSARAVAHEFVGYFMIAVTIIVAAVPEGLPMSITVSLAYSMRKMTSSNCLVRRMHACETVGAATVICTDKTGTLTRNEMRVQAAEFPAWEGPGPPGDRALGRLLPEAVAANTTAHLDLRRGGAARAVGNPTEGALLLWLEENGIDYLPLRERFRTVYQWTFSTERKYMGTLGVSAVTGNPVFYAKGAPEILLDRCSRVETADGPAPLEGRRGGIEAALRSYQARGMRCLGLAFREAPERDLELNIGYTATGLVWLGFVAIADPVREEVPEAVRACREAGVRVIVVTGDSPETAREVARRIGLRAEAEGGQRSGAEFSAMGEEDARAAARSLEILSRARPADKLRLVRLLQKEGHVVAATGDGTNDAPALNHADVGLAMGKSGTAVAREAGDMILLDDSFQSIVTAIRWGRSVYLNIQRFLLFQLTISAAAVGIALAGPFLGLGMPFTVTQILWINLIMDTFAALALATEPPDDGLMKKPPRDPAEFIVTRTMAGNLLAASLSFLALFLGGILFLWRDGVVTEIELSAFFTTFVLLQFWNLFNARAFGLGRSALSGLGRNRSFLAIATLILAGQVVVTQYGGAFFRTVPLPFPVWAAIFAGTSVVLWAGEFRRWRQRRLSSPCG